MKRTAIGALVAVAFAPACMESEDEVLSEDESEVINGTPWPEQNSGMVRLFMPQGRGCSGTLMTNDFVLTAKHCVPDLAASQVTTSMASESRNVSSITLHPSLDVALLRLSSPYTMFGRTTGHQTQLYPHATNTLQPGTNLLCRGYGETAYNTMNGGTLMFAVLPVRGVNFTWWGNHVDLGVNSNALGQFLSFGDSGGSCFATLPSGQQVLAGVTSRVYNNFDGSFNDLVGAESFRSWYEGIVTPAANIAEQWGTWGDIPLPADFDGDRRADFVVFRPGSGTWFVKSSASRQHIKTQQWGQAGDIPIAKDFTRDGIADFGIFRNGVYFILDSVTGASFATSVGVAGDRPVPADYDGDGVIELAIWRPSNGLWISRLSLSGLTMVKQWGTNGDVPVPADYDRNGIAELGVWRSWTGGEWFTKNVQTDFGRVYTRWGEPGDIPSTAYVGCGGSNVVVFRPSPAGFWVTGDPVVGYGQTGDVPVMADYTGSTAPDYAVWRPSTGMWFVAANPRVGC